MVTTFLRFEGEHWEYGDTNKETYRWIEPVTDFQTLRDEVKVTQIRVYRLSALYAISADFPLMGMKVKAVQMHILYGSAFPNYS